MSLKKATDYLNNDLQVDSALKDARGQVIHKTYQKKGELSYPTVTITLAQVLSADPLEIQLTDEQYSICENNNQILCDTTALGFGDGPILFNKSGFNQANTRMRFYTNDNNDNGLMTVINIDTTTKVSTTSIIELHLQNVTNSDNATNGQVLTADGDGGASWQTPASGGGTQLYQHRIVLNDSYYYIKIINTYSTPYTFTDIYVGLSTALVNSNNISISFENLVTQGDAYDINLSVICRYDTNEFCDDIYIYCGNKQIGRVYSYSDIKEIRSINITSAVDTVTPL